MQTDRTQMTAFQVLARLGRDRIEMPLALVLALAVAAGVHG